MKYNKGFIGLAIAIIAGLVLIGGGTYVYLNKGITKSDSSKIENTINSNSDEKSLEEQPKTTNSSHISGLFSFSHPSNWTVTEGPGAATFYEGKYTKNENDLDISISTNENIAAEYENRPERGPNYFGSPSSKENIKIGNILAVKFFYKQFYGQLALQSVYIIPVTYNGSKISIVAIATSLNGSSKWLVDVDTALKSMKIDATKVPNFLELLKDKHEDANAKAMLGVLQSFPGSYINSHLNYLGLCTTKTGSFYAIFSDLKKKVNNQIKCTEEEYKYAVSIKLPVSGEYYCIDSTGFFNKIPAFHTLKTCVEDKE